MTGGYFYFKDGWTKFAADNMIEEGNWIAYEYFSHGILDFKVYDHSDCLTQGVGGHISNKPDEQDINIEPDIDVVGHTDDRGDHPERANVMDAREGDPKGSQEKDKRRPREDSSSNDQPRGGQVRDDSTNSTRKRSKRDHDWYGEELFRSVVIQQPHNAYFVTKKKKNRAGELLVPKEVIRAYDLKLPESVLLIDPQEKKFHDTRKTWSDGRTVYAGGWKGLCGMNFVGDEHSIICEFVHVQGNLCIRVSLVPPEGKQS